MSAHSLTIDVRGLAQATGELQRIRNGIANRGKLNAAIAVDAQQLTQAYVAGHSRHKTAQKLGATPTGHHQRSAKRIEAASDNEAAIIRIPRDTGLGRAFSSAVIRPGTGRKYLTIPACAETYGKVVRDFPAGTFAFTIVGGRFAALMWKKAGGSHNAWTVAYWLRREVNQKQDRTLLPSDAAYQELGRRRAVVYIASLRYRAS
jgi:hypothetical protein